MVNSVSHHPLIICYMSKLFAGCTAQKTKTKTSHITVLLCIFYMAAIFV